MIKFTLITVTYNAEETLERTLHSVAEQTYPHIEHLLIDGASKDRTLEIAKNFPHLTKIVSEPDATEQGITLYTCTDCGRVKVEYTTPEQSQGNAAPLATDEAVAFGTGAVIGGLVGLIGGGIVFRFVVPKRKKVI